MEISYNTDCIVIDNNYFKIQNTVDLVKFTQTKEFDYLVYKIFKVIKRKRKLINLDIEKLFTDIGNDEINYIKLDDSFIPLRLTILQCAFVNLEKDIGQKMMSSFTNYDDVLNFQKTIKYCSDYLTEKDLSNFDIVQHKQAESRKMNFLKAESNLKKYIKMFKGEN